MVRVLKVAAIVLWLGASCLATEDFSIHGTTDRDVAIYSPGEPMGFTFQVYEGDNAVGGKILKWKRTGDDGKTESGEGVAPEEGLTVTTSLNQPGFVRIEVEACGESGEPLQGYIGGFNESKIGDIFFDGGACVEPDKLEPIAEPSDFDDFWSRAKKLLAAVPIKAARKELVTTNTNARVYALEVDCAGAMPVTGYLSIPIDADPGSLPAVVSFHGYGVREHLPPEWSPADKIIFDINAHGMKLGADAAYYEQLKKSLDGYCFNNQQNEKPETSYYYGMALRVMRALQYVKSLPEWDGESLRVRGGSQGGLQALWAAALDPDVVECTANVPWTCDLGGITEGRLRGWRPDYVDALNYFDPVFHARRIKAKAALYTRFGDYTCPPSSVWVVYNNVPHDRKSITIEQGGTHGYVMRNARQFTRTPEGISEISVRENKEK